MSPTLLEFAVAIVLLVVAWQGGWHLPDNLQTALGWQAAGVQRRQRHATDRRDQHYQRHCRQVAARLRQSAGLCRKLGIGSVSEATFLLEDKSPRHSS